MKIAIVSPYDWSYPGGVRTHIERLSAELRSRGHSVRIITSASGSHGRTVEYGIYKMGWAAPVRLNGSVARVAISTDLKGALRRLLTIEKFDIMHVHEPFASTLTLAIIRMAETFRIPVVATFHASSSQRSSGARLAYAMASPFLQSTFRKIDAAIAVSETAQQYVSRYFSGEYHVIPNGIDIARFAGDVPVLPQYQDDKRNVLFLSRMEPRKGLKFLLKAIPLVRKRMEAEGLPPVRFILVGDGPQRSRFQKYVQHNNWDDIVFAGFITDAEKPSYYKTADIYCAPSTGNESQGITLLEAMATGTPVIASDIPGYRTVITESDIGIMIPPKDPERLAWAICHLLRNEQTRAAYIKQGRLCAEGYDWRRVTTQIEQIYKEGVEHFIRRRNHQLYQHVYETDMIEDAASSLQSHLRPSIETPGWGISSFEENVVE